MCKECFAEWSRWLDYTLPPEPIRIHSVGSGKMMIREIIWRKQRRFEEWKDTIRFHQDLIKRTCIERHQGKDEG